MLKIKTTKYATTCYQNQKEVSRLNLGTTGSYGKEIIEFEFDQSWEGLTKTVTFWVNNTPVIYILEQTNRLTIDNAKITEDTTEPRVMVICGFKENVAVNTINCYYTVSNSMGAGLETQPQPTPTVVEQILSKTAQDRLVAETSAEKAEIAANFAQTTANNFDAHANNKIAEVTVLSENAEVSATNAKISETNADQSQSDAETAKTQAQLALSDLLSMMGEDIATLVNGKIPMSQIPATATQEIYTVTNENELTALTAQRGDLAELIEIINGEQTITKTWQCLGDSTHRNSWVVWGTSYAVQSGSAESAESANNANMINNHRLVEIPIANWESTVKDSNTYYFVY